MKQYDKANVEIISAKQLAPGKTEILYQPILDSMYYCPGATIRQVFGREKITFVRCGINENCAVDVAAENTGNGRFRIIIPSSLETIDLVFSDGEDRLAK